MKVVRHVFLPPEKYFEHIIPTGTQILGLCDRAGQCQMYFICDDDGEEKEVRSFCILNDNEKVDAGSGNKLVYVGSSFCSKIDGVSRHLFEIIPL